MKKIACFLALCALLVPAFGQANGGDKAIQGFVAYLANGGRSRKTVENVLGSLSSRLKTARSWEYAVGNFHARVME